MSLKPLTQAYEQLNTLTIRDEDHKFYLTYQNNTINSVKKASKKIDKKYEESKKAEIKEADKKIERRYENTDDEEGKQAEKRAELNRIEVKYQSDEYKNKIETEKLEKIKKIKEKSLDSFLQNYNTEEKETAVRIIKTFENKLDNIEYNILNQDLEDYIGSNRFKRFKTKLKSAGKINNNYLRLRSLVNDVEKFKKEVNKVQKENVEMIKKWLKKNHKKYYNSIISIDEFTDEELVEWAGNVYSLYFDDFAKNDKTNEESKKCLKDFKKGNKKINKAVIKIINLEESRIMKEEDYNNKIRDLHLNNDYQREILPNKGLMLYKQLTNKREIALKDPKDKPLEKKILTKYDKELQEYVGRWAAMR